MNYAEKQIANAIGESIRDNKIVTSAGTVSSRRMGAVAAVERAVRAHLASAAQDFQKPTGEGGTARALPSV